jgi:hypothetical protein
LGQKVREESSALLRPGASRFSSALPGCHSTSSLV